ncbi:MAG: hypothetical protein ACREEA_06105 [Stellaceae bacterium]
MGKFILIAFATLVVLVVVGGGVLALWHVPAPMAHVEHPIPDAQLPR